MKTIQLLVVLVLLASCTKKEKEAFDEELPKAEAIFKTRKGSVYRYVIDGKTLYIYEGRSATAGSITVSE